MLWNTISAARDLGRLHEIVSVLLRYEFGDLVDRLGVREALERAGHALHPESPKPTPSVPAPERVRHMLQELGPSFVKLGQVLATRIDLLPPHWISELEKLQNQVPPVEYAAIRTQIESDLGSPPENIFATFNPVALAAASIAQVHCATLANGRRVVVKVRRPDIQPRVEGDMRLLLRLARVIEERFPEFARFQPRAIVLQLQASLRREMDLAGECRNAERIAANFADEPALFIPKVHWQWTCERMNVQDFVEGIAINDVAALEAAGCDTEWIARFGAQIEMKMMFEDGFFHADPHPGNVFWLADDRLALIDFGMVGRLSEQRRLEVVELLDGIVRRDAGRVTEVLLEWAGGAEQDELTLSETVEAFIDDYHGVPLKDLDLGKMLGEIAALLREQQLHLPADLAMMIKVMVTLEGMGRRLDPDFDLATEARPFLTRAISGRYAPARVAREGWQAVADSLRVLSALPHDIRRLLRTARTGRLGLDIDVPRLRDLGEQLNHSTNRLTVGLVVAALIVGSSIVMTVGGGPTLLGLPSFGLLGFLGAVLGSLWLLLSITRSGGGR